MSPGLKALLSGLIDYAGLFPPAKLPLPEAVRNYTRYRACADSWMLGRFVCPASRLDELVSNGADLCSTEQPFTISALGHGGTTAHEFMESLRDDLGDIAACRERYAGRVVIDVLELRLPMSFQADLDALLVARLWARMLADFNLFFETPLAETLPNLLGMIAPGTFAKPAGFKLRCGGPGPSSFPSSEQLALALTSCHSVDVPLKATAGLHHPFPRFDPAVGARMHGFINLAVAGVLVHARGINSDRARAILDDDDPAHFTFDENGLRWQDLHASVDEITRARSKAVLSFGSCSFDEPRDDLRALGWMGKGT
jgi:hypothetical protein